MKMACAHETDRMQADQSTITELFAGKLLKRPTFTCSVLKKYRRLITSMLGKMTQE